MNHCREAGNKREFDPKITHNQSPGSWQEPGLFVVYEGAEIYTLWW
jgi:hypothetical protein